jgi:transposase
VWDAAFEIRASLGPPADEEHAIDSTVVRAHQHAAGVKGGIKTGVKGGIKRSERSAARAAASQPKSISARMLKARSASGTTRAPARTATVIERCFGRLRDFCRIATRYDKRAGNFFSALCLVASVAYWL